MTHENPLLTIKIETGYRHDCGLMRSGIDQAAGVDTADAYAFMTPEYNFGPPPFLLNAPNYVYKEWNYKPAGIVSYGGVSGGLRSAPGRKAYPDHAENDASDGGCRDTECFRSY